jgi:hypothetical protein
MPELSPFYRACVFTAILVSIPGLLHATLFTDTSAYFGIFYGVYAVATLIASLTVRGGSLLKRILVATALLSVVLSIIGFYARSFAVI